MLHKPTYYMDQHGDHVVYSRDQLVVFRDTAVLLPEVRPDVPRELRRRKRGCHAGVKCQARKRRFKPVLPSIIMGNLRSLVYEMNELMAVTRHQSEYRECSLMVFTETWLTDFTPDTHAALDGFQHHTGGQDNRER